LDLGAAYFILIAIFPLSLALFYVWLSLMGPFFYQEELTVKHCADGAQSLAGVFARIGVFI